MWTWSLNSGAITAYLVVGSCPMTPVDLGRIQAERGVGGILSLQHNDCLAYWGIDDVVIHRKGAALGLTMSRCPIRDFDINPANK